MLKIAHFGAYGTNIGDTVALDNIRLQISKHIDEAIEWVPINIIGFLDCKNDKSYILKTFRELTKGCSALFIGGGGLLEGGPFFMINFIRRHLNGFSLIITYYFKSPRSLIDIA